MSQTLPTEVQALLDRTRAQGGFTAAQLRDIEAAIRSSEPLQRYIRVAISNDSLNHLAFARKAEGMAGYYDSTGKVVHLTPLAWGDDPRHNRSQKLDILTGTLGHEVGHAVLQNVERTVYRQLNHDLNNANYAGLQAPIQHTPSIARYISAMRTQESYAEIMGWNAVHGRVKQELGNAYTNNAFLSRVAPTTHCVTDSKPPKPAPGIHLLPDGSLPLGKNAPNQKDTLEAVAQCHFDREPKPGRGLSGLGADYNYRNYYAAAAVNVLARLQTPRGVEKTLRLDFESQGLSPAQMEQAGIQLGGAGNTIRYEMLRGERIVGSGQLRDIGRPRSHGSPDNWIEALQQPASLAEAFPPSHPQHGLYQAIKSKLPEQTSQDRLAQITADAHAQGMREAKDLQAVLVVGETVHVLSHIPGFRSKTDLNQPPPTLEQSQQQIEATQQQQQALEMQRQEQQQQQRQQVHVLY